MTAKVSHVEMESLQGQLFPVFVNLRLSLKHLKRDLPKSMFYDERPTRKDQLEDCIEQLFKIVE